MGLGEDIRKQLKRWSVVGAFVAGSATAAACSAYPNLEDEDAGSDADVSDADGFYDAGEGDADSDSYIPADGDADADSDFVPPADSDVPARDCTEPADLEAFLDIVDPETGAVTDNIYEFQSVILRVTGSGRHGPLRYVIDSGLGDPDRDIYEGLVEGGLAEVTVGYCCPGTYRPSGTVLDDCGNPLYVEGLLNVRNNAPTCELTVDRTEVEVPGGEVNASCRLTGGDAPYHVTIDPHNLTAPLEGEGDVLEGTVPYHAAGETTMECFGVDADGDACRDVVTIYATEVDLK
ncbi:hypothetical protein KY362_04275 [Candidatus Woesearchaeota archaeon]|nr:hypothetical protein [Candidatus Woesearchaeota archaeon]